MRQANDELLLIAQIESVRGLENVEQIAAVEGIDVLWIGHFDLTNSLGIPAQFAHPDYLRAVERVVAACVRYGKAAGFMVADVEGARAGARRRASASSPTGATCGSTRRGCGGGWTASGRTWPRAMRRAPPDGESGGPPRAVRAGPVSALLDGAFLRRIRVGPDEVLRGVYAAVRDQNWGTVEPTFSRYELEAGADSFRLRFTAEHRQGEIDFVWDGEYVGEPSGRIVFRFDGVCRTAFRKNRIGFCVLHPPELAGTPYVRETPAGPIEERFPERISPRRDVTDIEALRYQAGPVGVALRFQGDLFDMEDQRNWTDASYKTFCTPLALPYPVRMAAGQRISQTVTLDLQVPPGAGGAPPRRRRRAGRGRRLPGDRGAAADRPRRGLRRAAAGARRARAAARAPARPPAGRARPARRRLARTSCAPPAQRGRARGQPGRRGGDGRGRDGHRGARRGAARRPRPRCCAAPCSPSRGG